MTNNKFVIRFNVELHKAERDIIECAFNDTMKELKEIVARQNRYIAELDRCDGNTTN